MRSLGVFFGVNMDKLLNKQSSFLCSETSWHYASLYLLVREDPLVHNIAITQLGYDKSKVPLPKTSCEMDIYRIDEQTHQA